ncbi:hypothetical protein D3C87_1835880 [compost metagenome]
METGSFIALINRNTGIFKYNATGNKTKHIKPINAKYSVAKSINRFFRISTPRCPTVKAIAAPTPTGAKYMIKFVNLNMVSDKLSVKSTKGFLFFSSTIARPIPNKTENTTI